MPCNIEIIVYMKLSWMEFGAGPHVHPNIVAPPKTPACFHSDSSGAYVWLRVRGRGNKELRESWVRFSELLCLRMFREHCTGASPAATRLGVRTRACSNGRVC